jgi:hypothetical protein
MIVMLTESYRSCNRRFHHKNPGVRVPSSSIIFELVRKVYSTRSFLDKKYTTEDAVESRKCFLPMKTNWDNFPCNSLAHLAQEAQLSKTKHGESLKTYVYGCIK